MIVVILQENKTVVTFLVSGTVVSILPDYTTIVTIGELY